MKHNISISAIKQRCVFKKVILTSFFSILKEKCLVNQLRKCRTKSHENIQMHLAAGHTSDILLKIVALRYKISRQGWLFNSASFLYCTAPFGTCALHGSESEIAMSNICLGK